jgi:hypothetical protein
MPEETTLKDASLPITILFVLACQATHVPIEFGLMLGAILRLLYYLQIHETNPELCNRIIFNYAGIAIITATSGLLSSASTDATDLYPISGLVLILILALMAATYEKELDKDNAEKNCLQIPQEQAILAAEIAMELIKEYPDPEALFTASQPQKLVAYKLSPAQITLIQQITGNAYNRLIHGTS